MGPITVEKADAILTVDVQQHIESDRGTYKRWSFVSVELLDENKNYLSSFGGEFWRHAEYDEETYDESYRVTLRVPKPATYYLRLKAKSNVKSAKLSPIEVEVESTYLWGAPAPLQVSGYLAFFLGIAMMFSAREGDSFSY